LSITFNLSYTFFANQVESLKWKNSVRHNLSRHKYFIKSMNRNAQGYYWSIHPSYITMFNDGLTTKKDIRKLKFNMKPRSSTKPKMSVNKAKESVSTMQHTSLSSPDSKTSFNSTNDYNDSAYLSSNDTDSSVNQDKRFKFLKNRKKLC